MDGSSQNTEETYIVSEFTTIARQQNPAMRGNPKIPTKQKAGKIIVFFLDQINGIKIRFKKRASIRRGGGGFRDCRAAVADERDELSRDEN